MQQKSASRGYTVLFARAGINIDGHKSLSTSESGGTGPTLRPFSRVVPELQ